MFIPDPGSRFIPTRILDPDPEVKKPLNPVFGTMPNKENMFMTYAI
jgi:hypothetical protein